MRRLAHALLVAAMLLPAGAIALHGPEAAARVAYESPYTFEQTFGTAIRLIRVDLGCKITEKDADSGYVLFDYTSNESGNKVHHGSLEIVRSRQGAHVSVQLPALPAYHEQMIVDALARKLLGEHGDPPARDKAAPPPAAPEDAGADAPR